MPALVSSCLVVSFVWKEFFPDPSKVEANVNMTAPTTITELRRFMNMVNQLEKFTPDIAEVSQPLPELLTMICVWTWGPSQVDAFQKIKETLTQPWVLALYNPSAPTKVSADASAYGLGAVLLQRSSKQHWRPVTYASRLCQCHRDRDTLCPNREGSTCQHLGL